MKTKLILAGCMAVSLTTNAQVAWPGVSPGKGYTQSTVRVGGTANPATGTSFHVGNGSGSLHYTGGGDGSMQIKGAAGDRAILELEDPSGTNRTIFQSLATATYFNAGINPSTSAPLPLYLQGQGGRIGINNYSPAYLVDINTSGSNDGVSITQTGTSASALHMTNSASGGRHWALFSAGSVNAQGAGNFSIFDYNSGNDRLFINGSTGNVGIGTISPASGKLQVYNTNASVFASGYFSMNCNNFSRATYAEATGGATNWAGTFIAGSGGSNETQNISIIASLASSTNPNNDWAAYLMGRTYCTAGVWTSSDRNLKDNVKPIENALDKLKLLQPSTYTFKTGEYKGMNLPDGEQMGLIAQDVEKIFPSAVAEVKGITQKNEKGDLVINTPDHKSVNYTSLIPVLIAGIQEQQAHINLQDQEMAELKNEISRLRSASAGATGIDQNNPGANGFAMSQNEPNPFSQETVVKYTLPTSVNSAFMSVYDLTGKQVATWPVTEKGTGAVTITSEKLQAGIYIYTIVADGKVVDSKRMIVADKH